MLPIEASSLLATLVGLICNWSQERSAQAEDRFQDFMVWLSHHHFEGLCTGTMEAKAERA